MIGPSLHLHDALGQVGRDLRQAFAAAVHDVVVAGAAGRTHGHLGGTRPGLGLNWTWRHTVGDEMQQSHCGSVKVASWWPRYVIAYRSLGSHFGIAGRQSSAWITSFLIYLLTNV